MPIFTIELTEDEAQHLGDMAALEGTTPEAAIQLWVRQWLVHEGERAAGTAKPLSPRSRRAARQQEKLDLL